jgi:hypothetical protein
MLIDDFARLIRPLETVLLLGAGVSVPSGGMTGAQLAAHLCADVSDGSIESDDLAEAASLLEHQYSREAIVNSLSSVLGPLRPDGGMLGLMAVPWARIYTTNYDQLVERAARSHSIPLKVIRSNRDFGRLDQGDLELLKIHGCITQDRALGHQDSMVLTQGDYRDYAAYREALFGRMFTDLLTKDVLIIGQSLRDPHLRRLVDDSIERAVHQNLSHHIKVLTYANDSARLGLLEQRGIQASSGTLDQLLESLNLQAPASPAPLEESRRLLPKGLLHRTVDAVSARAQDADPVRMFNGGSASYADIFNGYTFARSPEAGLLEELYLKRIQYVTITGAAGVGKSTLARRLINSLADRGYAAYEHKPEFPLSAELWTTVGEQSAAQDTNSVLLVQAASKELAAINALVRSLDSLNNESLQVILTSHTAQWQARSRSSRLITDGRTVELTTLEPPDISALVDLCADNAAITRLLRPEIRGMTRWQQRDAIQRGCRSDMFVALKYCFPGEDIDQIVLSEYASLGSISADVYKYVALIESAYGIPSRQLILECLGLSWENIADILRATTGIIKQTLTHRKDAIYSWTTRHPVIADIITKYKFYDQGQLFEALDLLISHMNAALLLDRQMIPNLCDSSSGIIARLEDPELRLQLYERLTQMSTNAVPWHRIIGIWMSQDELDNAAQALSDAERAVGEDSVIHRYKVLLKIRRAKRMQEALSTTDHVAILFRAWADSLEGANKWPDNKYMFISISDVAIDIAKATGSPTKLSEAYEIVSDAYDRILDEDLLRTRSLLANKIRVA